MARKALVMEIKGNSQDDGPGIRSVVFFKGCPLNCAWCHNPESKSPGQELCFDAALCLDCGECQKVCPREALSQENPGYVDRQQCNLCMECSRVCPTKALAPAATEMDADQIVSRVLTDKPFYDASGGGVTLSGGEPTLRMEFLSGLVQSLKKQGLHVLLETCGLFSFDSFEKSVLPFLDMIYFDIKIMESGQHEKFCGVSNRVILDNFSRLAEICPEKGVKLLPRTPLVPTMTATKENLDAIAGFLAHLEIPEAGMLAYNPLWMKKKRKNRGQPSPGRVGGHEPVDASATGCPV